MNRNVTEVGSRRNPSTTFPPRAPPSKQLRKSLSSRPIGKPSGESRT